MGEGPARENDSTTGVGGVEAAFAERLRAAGAYVFDAPVRHHPDLPPESSFRVCFMFGLLSAGAASAGGGGCDA